MYAFVALLFGSAVLMGIVGALRHRWTSENGVEEGSDEGRPSEQDHPPPCS